MSPRKSGPAGLRGLREQVAEAKEGPLELGREKAKELTLRENGGKKGADVL